MRAKTLVGIGFGLLAGALSPRAVQAESAASDPTVVATVGNRVITAGELARRMEAVPAFQLRTLGHTPSEIRRAFLERVLIREALLNEGAHDAKLDEREEIKDRLRGVLRNAMVAQLRKEASAVSDAEVVAYYAANTAKFHTPARVEIWRIQVAKKEEAEAIIEDMKRDPSAKHWVELARDKSLDKATGMHGGVLGFVAADGTTAEPGYKVDPVIVAAAMAGKDASILPEPVKDGERYSVLWKRNTVKARTRPIETEAGPIRNVIALERTEKKLEDAEGELRKKAITEWNPDLVDLVDIGAGGEVQPLRRPGSLPPRRASNAAPIPSVSPGGMLR